MSDEIREAYQRGAENERMRIIAALRAVAKDGRRHGGRDHIMAALLADAVADMIERDPAPVMP